MRYFDLHCDTLTELKGESLSVNRRLHISLDRAPETYIQCFAIFIPDSIRGAEAWEYYCKYRDIFIRQAGQGEFLRITDENTLSQAAALGRGGILTVESGAVLGGRLSKIEQLARDGVTMLTLTWNSANELGFGSSENKGLTSFGKEAVKELENCGIILDVSHLSDEGFADVCEITTAPFVASHSNCYCVHPHRRNLKDWQIKEIVNRKGLIGVNFYSEFLNSKRARVTDIGKHISYLESLETEKSISFGADFDGMNSMPKGVRGVESIPYVYTELKKLGMSDIAIDKYFYNNAFDFFNRLWRNKK